MKTWFTMALALVHGRRGQTGEMTPVSAHVSVPQDSPSAPSAGRCVTAPAAAGSERPRETLRMGKRLERGQPIIANDRIVQRFVWVPRKRKAKQWFDEVAKAA